MFDWLMIAQLALSVGLLGVVVERVHYLLYVAPVSAQALRWLGEAVDLNHADRALRWARARPRAHASRVLLAVLSPGPDEDDLAELLGELTERAVVRLRLLRVGATVASTTGLLVGILRISGYGSPGLLALQAGRAERFAMSSALFSMAVGVGTSAVCFYATSLLREAAQQLLGQAARLARTAKKEL